MKLKKYPNWLVGFTSAEGCFYVSTGVSKTKIGYTVNLWFILTQHSRDAAPARSLAGYWQCGNVIMEPKNPVVRYRVSRFSENLNIIIPFFEKYPIQGKKFKDFLDFCKVANLINDKAHLTKEGFEKIKNIKKSMNTGREVI